MAEKKKHVPTPKRLREARREGKVLKSSVLTSAIGLTSCFAALYYAGETLWFNNQMLLQYVLVQGFDSSFRMLSQFAWLILKGTVSVLGCVALFAVLLEVWIIGFKFEWRTISPNFSRLNPAQGLNRISSGFKEIWLTAFFVLLFVLSAVILVFGLGISIPNLVICSSEQLQRYFQETSIKIMATGCTVFWIAGIVEFLWKRNQLMSELSMSDDEVRREYKEDEGDPMFRSLRKSRHQDLLHQDLVKQVRQAKVIIVERA